VVAVLVLATIGLVVLALSLAQRGTVQVRLGDERFDAGQVERISPEIADRGPILYSDVAGGDRDILINHLGPDNDSGWFAFDARSPGSPRDCFLTWIEAEAELEDTCSAERFGPDGAGLEQYPAVVVDGRVIVDLNAADRPPETTTTILVTGIPRDEG